MTEIGHWSLELDTWDAQLKLRKRMGEDVHSASVHSSSSGAGSGDKVPGTLIDCVKRETLSRSPEHTPSLLDALSRLRLGLRQPPSDFTHHHVFWILKPPWSLHHPHVVTRFVLEQPRITPGLEHCFNDLRDIGQANLDISWSVLFCLDKLKVDIHWTVDEGGLATLLEVVHWDIEGDAACS